MIPQLVTVRVRRSNGRRVRVYLPVLPVALLLSPLLLLAVLGGCVACLVFRIGPVGALRGAARVLWASPGTRFEVEQGRTAVLVSVR
ncbi:hypothetical protein [Streptomyces hoynatensis]|uniref:Uncharacterized protein n=1 Tax=Streptomyces hoynatensis TaxID=1141874 RepID=A0A3A9Z6F3_9ACTN|nr:hypothetical protein [Streptomyces hoynatensis]RKN43853.1 hypothetical protein D7294_09085 [Streptomyces hoynatensis]